MRICVQSRECSTAMLESLAGSTLFPDRPIGAAIVSALHRRDGSVICVSAPAMADEVAQVDYFVRLGMATTRHSGTRSPRERVTLLSIEDRSSRWLSEKLLDPDRPDAVAAREHLHAAVAGEQRAGRDVALMQAEPSAPMERLARELGVLGDQAPSWARSMGAKTAGKDMFRDLQIPVAAATPLVWDLEKLAEAIAILVRAGHRRFVLKLDSTAYMMGMGNAFFDVDEDTAAAADLPAAIAQCLPDAQVMDLKLGWAGFSAAIPVAGVLAEELITGDVFRSPTILGKLSRHGAEVVATHEQILAANRQTAADVSFPAAEPYRMLITNYGQRIGEYLHERGIERGDYGVDFVAVNRNGDWQVYACELNLRSTATRNSFDMVTMLLATTPDPNGELHVGDGRRVYLGSDNITSARYVGLRPRTLIEAVENSPLNYDPVRKCGVVLQWLSALPEHGRFSAVCIAESAAAAEEMMRNLRELVNDLCQESGLTGSATH